MSNQLRIALFVGGAIALMVLTLVVDKEPHVLGQPSFNIGYWLGYFAPAIVVALLLERGTRPKIKK